MTVLPSGTVTFLFTDIEESTERWERDRAALKTVVKWHLTGLRLAAIAHGGALFTVVDDVGQAALLRRKPWPVPRSSDRRDPAAWPSQA
jgi:acyl-coenzyme A thioesterase PaaI-like protein